MARVKGLGPPGGLAAMTQADVSALRGIARPRQRGGAEAGGAAEFGDARGSREWRGRATAG